MRLRTNRTHALTIVNNSNYFYLEELGKDQDCEQCEEVGTNSDDEDDTAADQQEPLKLKSYKEAVIQCPSFWNTKDMEMKPCPSVALLTEL